MLPLRMVLRGVGKPIRGMARSRVVDERLVDQGDVDGAGDSAASGDRGSLGPWIVEGQQQLR